MARIEEGRDVYRVLVEKPEGKSPFGRGEDNIKMGLQEVGWRGMDWIDLAEDSQMADICNRGNDPSGSIKCG